MEIISYISKKTEILYNNFKKENKILIILYIFSFLIIGIDLTSLLFAITKKKYFDPKKIDEKNWTVITPFLVEWFITILFLIYYKYKLRIIKKQVVKIIDGCKTNMKCASEYNIQNLLKKLNLIIKYYKNDIFEKYLQLIIIFYIPVAIKIIVFEKSQFKRIFTIYSSIFFLIMILKSLFKCIIIKIKSHYQMRNNNLKYYNEQYPLNTKILDISKYSRQNKSFISEIFMIITSFLIKGFLYILCILYFSQIGDKLDDPINGCSWVILFIPIFILFVPIIVYSILHCISLSKIFLGKIWIVIITCIPCILSFQINSILIPMILDNRISINYYYIPFLNIFGTIMFGIHIKIVNNKLKEYK